MQFIKHLSRWALSGPRAWLSIIFIIFIVLSFVYKSLVSPANDLNEYTLPSVTDVITGKGYTSKVSNNDNVIFPQISSNTDEDNDYDSLVTMDPLQNVEQVPPVIPAIEYVIKPGDTLARIFARLGLSREALYSVLEADQEYLVLEPLLPDDKFTFKLDEDGDLLEITRRIDISKSVSYVQHDGGGFSYKESIKPITYTQKAVHSKIIGNFYLSAKKAGLSDTQILIINDLLKGRVNFRKDLRANDAFDFVIKSGSIDGVKVGDSQLEALEITVKGETYRAFLHSDGRFYDLDGNSLTPALLRWPTRKKYRISSPFNANRLHPITGHPAPHNGVDLATPSGTEVLATGDGVVTRVASHKYAGKYVVIDYTGPYGSRFLHLSKILVKKGQKVKRGQVIALSGNTGRTTGAHLHYELHIRGRPVNPMTAEIPTTQSIPKSDKKEYSNNVKRLLNMMMGNQVEDQNATDTQPESMVDSQSTLDAVAN
ncbi:peptidoglycan DD-metalloendopeptidase family protein [Marinomonas rhizomae]|uniref:Murein DD-endopeptidase n=1 Tax=Marinomonas rhizomae TaxID=491948 RepID=A0A366JAJ3_9GAMM|nr:peptidoglycan DD-metalloendopeptidase family protein [Marinomonas rhizomae]RBP83389.1 murein DD-endopeptidase [Marinomonas rhizomae]